LIENLGKREFSLNDGKGVAVTSGPMFRLEGMGKTGQPFTEDSLDFLCIEKVAEFLKTFGTLTDF
jgi:hypothetical protein